MAKSGGGAGRETDSAPDNKKVRLKKPEKGAKAPIVSVNPDAAPKPPTALQRGIGKIRDKAKAARQAK